MPGLDGTGRLFEPLVNVLGAMRCEVVRYPASARTPEDFLSAMPQPAEPFALVAESFSGPLAIRLAARAPEHLKALVLVATFGTAPRRALLWAAAHLGWTVPLTPHAIVRRALLGPGVSKSLDDLLRATLAEVPTSAFASRLRLLAATDVRDELARVTVPTLVLEADHDHVVPRAAVEALMRAAPHAVHRRLPGPHLLLQHAPEAAARELEAFLAGR